MAVNCLSCTLSTLSLYAPSPAWLPGRVKFNSVFVCFFGERTTRTLEGQGTSGKRWTVNELKAGKHTEAFVFVCFLNVRFSTQDSILLNWISSVGINSPGSNHVISVPERQQCWHTWNVYVVHEAWKRTICWHIVFLQPMNASFHDFHHSSQSWTVALETTGASKIYSWLLWWGHPWNAQCSRRDLWLQLKEKHLKIQILHALERKKIDLY